MDLALISIGTELVTGQTLDTNAVWLAGRVTRAGARVVRLVTVADSLERMRAVFREALACVDLVISTGGLGPTADDLTRQALAEAIGQPLEEHAEALKLIRTFFERWHRRMPEGNHVQAMIPRTCRVIPNHKGTAPGIHYQGPASELFALPGVPSEMKGMFHEAVLPVITRKGGGVCMVSDRVLCYGLSEARLGQTIEDLMAEGRNPSVGTTAKDAIISVRVLGRAASEGDAKRLLDADLAEIRRRLGSVVFGQGDDTLQHTVARLLRQQSKTVATAESCTGGLLAKRLTDIPGSSEYFLNGFVTYSNEAKMKWLGVSRDLLATRGAVSEPVAKAMAICCRQATGADFALAVTGIAGPSGGSPPEKPVGLVYIALADMGDVKVERMLFGEHLSRARIRDRSAKTALNILRLRLMEEP